MTSTPVVLTGLDGTNPLGFLAALGTLDVLHRRARSHDPAKWPRLAWINRGTWQPVLHGPHSVDAVIDAVVEDLRLWDEDPALGLAYTKDGRRVAPDHKDAIRDLKPPPEVMNTYLGDQAARAAQGESKGAELAAAFGTCEALDGSGQVKPTALHFTAGQQRFLSMVNILRDGVRREDVVEALVGPWSGTSRLPSLSWDASAPRMYALRSTDPSSEKRGSVPGAYWAAFLGLRFFPVSAHGRALQTTAVSGRWKSGRFTWPLWSSPGAAPSVGSLVARKDLSQLAAVERTLLGVEMVLASSISRSDQGGYGMFSPADVL